MFPSPAHTDDVVTMMTEPDSRMLSNPRRTAVCIVRVEQQLDGVLITLVLNPDINAVSTKRSHRTTEISNALATIRQFLVECTRTVPQ
jgi:hypothetical protein